MHTSVKTKKWKREASPARPHVQCLVGAPGRWLASGLRFSSGRSRRRPSGWAWADPRRARLSGGAHRSVPRCLQGPGAYVPLAGPARTLASAVPQPGPPTRPQLPPPGRGIGAPPGGRPRARSLDSAQLSGHLRPRAAGSSPASGGARAQPAVLGAWLLAPRVSSVPNVPASRQVLGRPPWTPPHAPTPGDT